MSFKLAPTKFHASAKLEVKRLQKPRLITLSLCAQPKYKKDGKKITVETWDYVRLSHMNPMI